MPSRYKIWKIHFHRCILTMLVCSDIKLGFSSPRHTVIHLSVVARPWIRSYCKVWIKMVNVWISSDSQAKKQNAKQLCFKPLLYKENSATPLHGVNDKFLPKLYCILLYLRAVIVDLRQELTLVIVNGGMKTMTTLHCHQSVYLYQHPPTPPLCDDRIPAVMHLCVWRTSRPAGLSQTQSHSTLITLRAVSTLRFNNTPCQLTPHCAKLSCWNSLWWRPQNAGDGDGI